EAGYKGEEIVWMSGQLEYNLSLAAKNQLEKAGFNIDLQAMEWATLADRRKNPELWNIFSTGMTTKPDPTMFTPLNPAGGNRESLMEKNKTSINPNQKLGIETPAEVITIIVLSKRLLWLIAAITPVIIPKTIAKIIPKKVRVKVTLKCS
ncbi:unnamed protein product, partial [marine sediment metagenome]